MVYRISSLAAMAFTGIAAWAQIGQPYPGGGVGYPGGGYPGSYPPGGYPGQYPAAGGGIPMPGRKGKVTQGKEATDHVSGTIRRISTTELILEPEDRRIITVALEKNTQYATNSGPAKYGDLDTGDQVSIDASSDSNGYLHALKVTLEKKAAAEETRRETPRAQIIDGDEVQKVTIDRPATTVAPRPAPADPDDPGPPALRRGIPPNINSASRAREDSPAPQPRPTARTGTDAFISNAREVAANFTETLPTYEVKQFTTRYETGAAQGNRTQWRALDVVTADVVVENGRESYRNLLINGTPAKDKIENSGSWSTGEFATVLQDVLSSATDADFFNKRTSTIVNRPAFRYDYTVEQPNSHWKVVASSQSYYPAYRGSVWFDKENSRVLRIEMSSVNMPKEFPLDKVESATEYDYVLIGDRKFLLPTHSESLSCVTGTGVCSKNVIEFRNYRKYGASSNIRFDPNE